MDIITLHPTIKDYSWGSRDHLPSLFHYKSDGQPQAEAWFGTHPDGPARLDDGRTLDQVLDHPLPFMLKVLAVNTPLSLHVHPDEAQVEAGWKREAPLRKAGADRKGLDYKDQGVKAELFHALSPSTLLVGLRAAEDMRQHLSRLLPRFFEPVFSAKLTSRGIIKTLFKLDEDSVAALCDEFLSSLEGEEVRRSGLFLTERGIAERLFSLQGPCPAVLMPYLMNIVHLRPGEAVLIDSGTLHSYIHGFGIELEDSSDNEVRLALGDHHQDPDEALRIMNYDEHFQGKAQGIEDRFLRQVFHGPRWSLALLPSGSYDIPGEGPQVLLCTEGRVRVGTGARHLVLGEGACCYIPASNEGYHVRVGGKAFQALL